MSATRTREEQLARAVNLYWLAGYSIDDLEYGLTAMTHMSEEERMRSHIIFDMNERDTYSLRPILIAQKAIFDAMEKIREGRAA